MSKVNPIGSSKLQAPSSPSTVGIDASRANAVDRTGTEWYAFHVIQELKRIIPAAVRVILYTREPLREDLKDLPPNWESRVLSWPPRRLWTQIRLSWEMLVRPPDLLFVPVHVLPIILPQRAVTTLHDVAFAVRPDAYGPFERWYQRFAVRSAAKRATAILTVSEFSKSELILHFRVPAAKIFPTPLGYDPEVFCRPVESSETRPAASVPDRPYFLFVGRLEWKKNVVGLLRAFKMYKEKAGPADRTILVLAGKPGYGGEEALRLLSEDEKLRQDVILSGYVGRNDLCRLYAGARAFVFPSWYEGFGLPVIEAMACGAPVIAARAASLPEVVGDAAILVEPSDAAGLAEALRRLADDRLLRDEMIRRGLARCVRYSWKKTAEMTWAAVKKSVEG